LCQKQSSPPELELASYPAIQLLEESSSQSDGDNLIVPITYNLKGIQLKVFGLLAVAPENWQL